MKEYIMPINDTAKDWDEMFIGAIRKQEELIRCKDCKWNADCICLWHSGIDYTWIVVDDDYCSCAEGKEE